MNIFVLNEDPIIAAQSLADVHVVKMVVETAQLLSTYLFMTEKLSKEQISELGLPKPTHQNHPCSKWLREHYTHPNWLNTHFYALLKEYSYRYNKEHKYQRLHKIFKKYIAPTFFVPASFVKVMPEEFRTKDAVESYKKYYISKQYTLKRPMRWTARGIPEWFEREACQI